MDKVRDSNCRAELTALSPAFILSLDQIDLCVCSGVAVNKERSEEGETGLGCKLQVGVSREMCMRRGGKHAM